MRRRSVSRAQNGPGAVELIEEALHLVRGMPAAVLARYFAATTGWTFGFLFFWAHTTWFSPSGPVLLWAALGLTVLYAILKGAQAEFCGRLWERRTGGTPAPWTWSGFGRLAVSQFRLQAWGLVTLPLALVVTLPFAWVWAFFQSATVLGTKKANTPELREAAWRQALLWPGSHHCALAMLSLIALVVGLNLATAYYALPWLANRLLGLDNFLGVNGWQMFNSTFLATVTAVTWMLMDPLVKAFYTLRVFHGQSLRTGEDLRMAIGAAGRKRRRLVGVAALLVLLAVAPGPHSLRAAGPAVPVAVDPVALDRSIDEVLAQRDFQWRLRPQHDGAAVREADGPVKRFFKQGFKFAAEMVRSLRSTFRGVEEWLKRLFPDPEKPKQGKNASSGSGFTIVRVLLYGLMAVVVGLVLFVVYLMIKQGPKRSAAVQAVGERVAAPVDLRDESVQAAQLPEEGWLALAREQMGKGEWRLALRALYLAHLARLGAEGLLSLARFKTNLDYERELRRRAAGRSQVIEYFLSHRQVFEGVWYGRESAAEETVRRWLDEIKGVQPA